MNTTIQRLGDIRFGQILFVLSLMFYSASAAHAAIRLQQFSAREHDRFYVGADKDFIGSAFDSSGVGRLGVGNRWATMISEHFFVTARHWQPVKDQTLRFFSTNDPNGPSEDHVVAGGNVITGIVGGRNRSSDLWLGRLATAPSDDIARYPILDLAEESDYENLEIYTYGLNFGTAANSQRLGRNTIDSFRDQTVGSSTGRTFRFDFDSVGGVGPDESFVQGGDSGGPSFVAFGNDEFALVGLHWFNIASILSGDTFVPHYLPGLISGLQRQNETLRTVVPEPSSIVLLLVMLVTVGIRRRAEFCDMVR